MRRVSIIEPGTPITIRSPHGVEEASVVSFDSNTGEYQLVNEAEIPFYAPSDWVHLRESSVRRKKRVRIARKKKALVPITPIGQRRAHQKEGWQWDYSIEGFVTTAAQDFPCDCGSSIPTPSHTKCACGKIWNSYVIGHGGEGREASIDKFVCREIPVRENVIVARKKSPRQVMKTSRTNYNNTMERDKINHNAQRRQDDGKHRKEFDWGRSPGFESDYWYTEGPDGLYTIAEDPYSGVLVEHHSDPLQLENGEVGDIYGVPQNGVFAPQGYPEGFPSVDEAKDWVERRSVPQQGGGRHRAKVDRLYREALQHKAEGRYRKEFDWQTDSSGRQFLETPGGDFEVIQPDRRKPNQWDLSYPDGYTRTMFNSPDEARDFAERSMSPDGYWPRHLKEER